jgi:hypothetical protein
MEALIKSIKFYRKITSFNIDKINIANRHECQVESLEKHDYRIQRLVNKIKKRTTRTETYKEFMANKEEQQN